MTHTDKKLLFSVEDDALYLHVNDILIIPFRDLVEWQKFALAMVDMMPEMAENIEQR